MHKIFVREDNSLPEVARTILKNRVNHIPVLNKEQKVVGLIRAVDVLDIVGNLLDS
ncbi:MAG: CBS domain-containing protein [Bacillota bacterium]